MRKPTTEDILKVLDKAYEAATNGIGNVSPPVSKMAEDYLTQEPDISKAAKKMLKMQITKCTTSGLITGFGGLITLPVTIPANIGSVLYVQMRMIACAAYMGGYDISSDLVQTLVYACLAGVSMNEIVKKFGMQFGNKAAMAGIKKIPGKALAAINQKIGFRLFTKFGEKGLINIGKMVPVVGAAINGGFDYVETKVIAARAYKEFIKHDFTPDMDEEIIDVTDVQ